MVSSQAVTNLLLNCIFIYLYYVIVQISSVVSGRYKKDHYYSVVAIRSSSLTDIDHVLSGCSQEMGGGEAEATTLERGAPQRTAAVT